MAEEQKAIATKEETKEEVALTPYQQATGMVRAYAAKLTSDDRAQEFATALSIMAKQQPLLLEARPESIVSAMMACVQLDLMPNTPMQHAFLIPYKGRDGVVVEFQVGYKGLVKLAQRGNVKSIAAEVVMKGDKFKVKLGTARQLVHEPSFDVDRSDTSLVTHAYMTAVLENGEKVFEVMSRTEIDKIKETALAKKQNPANPELPWNKWYIEQAKKTIIKRGAKLLPSSNEDNRLAMAAQFDSWAEAQKLKATEEGIIVEAEVSEEDKSAMTREKIENAERHRQEMTSDKSFKPLAVTPPAESNG